MARPLLLVASLTLLPAVAVTAGSRPAHAQSAEDKNTARALGVEGQDALDRKDFKTAEDRFARADALFHAPTLTLGLARAYAGGGKYVAAQETYNRIIREQNTSVPAFAKAYDEAKKEIDQVTPKIGGVTITVGAAGGGDVGKPSVLLDDKPVNAAALGVRRSIDPGTHVVKVTAEGYRPAEVRITVPEGGHTNAPVMLEKDNGGASVASTGAGTGTEPSGSSSSSSATGSTTMPPGGDTGVKRSASGQKTLGWIGLGVGAAGLAAGAVTGILALGKHSDLENNCPGGTCGSAQKSDVDSYHTLGTVSTVGFVVGGVGLAAGTILLLTAPKSKDPAKAQVVPYFGLGSVGAVGRF